MPDRRLPLLAACALAFATPVAAQTPPGPGEDFYGYANADWLAATTLPADRPFIDTTAQLRDQAAVRIREIVETAARPPLRGLPDGPSQRVGAWYAAWMDAAAIEARGLQPLSDDLAAIAAIDDRTALSRYLGHALRLDDGSNTATDGLFGLWIHQGFHDGRRYAAHLLQGGLGLSEPEAYVSADPAARDAYMAHIAAVLTLAGRDDAEARAARVLALETAIAATHASRADTDDVFKTDNPWTRADFDAKAPGIDWTAWFAAAGLEGRKEVIVWQPPAVIGSSALVASRPLEDWKDWLTFRQIEHYAAVLPATVSADPPADRAKQAVDAATAALGQDIGRLYVARYFPPEAKAAARAMAADLKTAFRARIAGLTWMSPETRALALDKLETLEVGVGYPDRWTDYAGLDIRPDDALGNLRRAEAFAYRQALAKLDQPVDPGEWSALLPQWPGAVLNFSPNSMQFSAGLLQPPFFDPAGDAAANYGSAGAGMAHEISHTFDALGAIWDAEGRLGRWQTPDDAIRLQAASATLQARYDAACVQPGQCVNGRQVLGEAVGDLAGLRVALDAWRLSLHGRPAPVIDGLTGDQRFFLAFARRWRRLQTDAALQRQLASDSHAPGRYRAETVRDLDEWYAAFDIRPGDPLWLAPEARSHVW